MTSYVTPKKNAAFILYVGLEDQANAGLLKAAPTLAAGDFKVSIDGGTLNNLTDLPTVTPTGGRMVKITLTAAEMNGDNVTVVCSDAAGAEWYDLIVNLQTTARQIDDLSTLGGTAQTGDAYAIVNHATYGNAHLARTGADSDTLETLSDQLDLVGGGATTYSYSDTIDDGSGNLLDGVFVQCATDTGFTNIVSTATTNSVGAFTVYSDTAGTHYLRLQFSGITFAIQTVTLA